MSENEMRPAPVFECFARVCQVPRPSKREEKMIDFLLAYGRGLGLETERDGVGNVVIRKPATPGMEKRRRLTLQSHMDMVCEKNRDVAHDFDRDAIETVRDGEWLRARGTTLGADDGIGVAMEMALLAASDIAHGPLECVFTRDEETGLTGAEGMAPGFMKGRALINLDSEDEGQFFVSCAGGCRTTARLRYKEEAVPRGYVTLSLSVKGLAGGHSGDDIDKKRANANKLLSRFLYGCLKRGVDLRLADIQAGGLHNAIPREAACVCAVPGAEKERMRVDWNLFAADVEEEYSVTERSMQFLMETADAASAAVDRDTARRLVTALQAVDNGVFAHCQDIDMVETSSNLASVRLNREARTIEVNSSQRSSLMSARQNMADTFAAAFTLAGAEVEIGEGYPGWKMNPGSELLAVAVAQYERLFGRKPVVRGIHAGLECGLFSEKFPGMDMISAGPTLRGVHSPDERLHIPSVQKVWDWLLAVLRHIPEE